MIATIFEEKTAIHRDVHTCICTYVCSVFVPTKKNGREPSNSCNNLETVIYFEYLSTCITLVL